MLKVISCLIDANFPLFSKDAYCFHLMENWIVETIYLIPSINITFLI